MNRRRLNDERSQRVGGTAEREQLTTTMHMNLRRDSFDGRGTIQVTENERRFPANLNSTHGDHVGGGKMIRREPRAPAGTPSSPVQQSRC